MAQTFQIPTIDNGQPSLYRTYSSLYLSKRIQQPVSDSGLSGASKTINWSDGNTQILTLDNNTTLTFGSAISGGVYTLIINQDAIGGWAVTFPIEVKWGSGGFPPVITVTPNAQDVLVFIFDGTNYLGEIFATNLQ